MESLIGIHLIAGVQEAALHFIHKIGIELSPNKMIIENFPPQIDIEDMTKENITRFKNTLQETELKYTFRKKLLLLQAMTNTSFNSSISESNERLAYIGKAVYEFFITRIIYEKKIISHRFNYDETAILTQEFSRLHCHKIKFSEKSVNKISSQFGQFPTDDISL